MKNNRIYKILFIFIFLLNNNLAFSNESFLYEAEKIKILDNGKTIVGKNDIKININKNIIIYADDLKYNRDTKILELFGNVNFIDVIDKINIKTEKLFYFEKDRVLELFGQVNLKDNTNNIKIKTEKLLFYEKNNKIFSPTQSEIIVENDYNIKVNNFEYWVNDKIVSSNDKVKINDKVGNTIDIEQFQLQIKNKRFKGNKIKFYDRKDNEFILQNALIDLKNHQIFGKDLSANFNKAFFGNSENDPRIKAKSIKKLGAISTMEKGVFTICKKNDDCPPWSIYADKIEHNNDTKIIKYSNALLKIYDVPVLYLPKFSHPDPTVKRQSGFLNPYFKDSKNFGSSITLPYYHVISENKDLTFSPRLFANDEIILQNEYRQVNKSNEHIFDFSLNALNFFQSKKDTKSHFFINSIFDLNIGYFDNSQILSNFEKVSNDNYLKTHKLESVLINDTNLLNSHLSFNGQNETTTFDVSIETYEDLSKSKSDRYEFVYPNFNFGKRLNIQSDIIENINFNSYGHQKKYNTNIYEGVVTNDILISSINNISKLGIKRNYQTFIKNVNSKGNNSNKFKDDINQSVYALFKLNNELPLIKEKNNFEYSLTPKVSLMYSPNKTKNISRDNTRIGIDSIYSLNRLANNEMVEGGGSATIGFDFKKLNKSNFNENLSISLATVVRAKKNEDLPTVSSIGQKNSDIFGKIDVKPNENFDIRYDFAVDNNLDKTNYNLISSSLKVNNFVTTFEYSNDKTLANSKKYLSNISKLKFSDNGLIGFNIIIFIFISLISRGLRFFIVSYLSYKFGNLFTQYMEKHGSKWFTVTGVLIVIIGLIIYLISKSHV